jgi:hypothetical protein
MVVTFICFIYGLHRALDEKQGATMLKHAPAPMPLPATAPQHAASWQPAPQPQPLPPLTKPLGPFVGNRVLGIFHEHDCPWVTQISAANLVNFTAPAEASSHGYKPCRVCLPAT